MRTTWRVKRVTETEGKTVAELVRVEWFKKNPAYVEMMDEYEDMVEKLGQEETDAILLERDREWVEEWLEDVQPGEEGAEFSEPGTDSLTIDVTDGLDLHPGDNVIVTLDALERVDA